MVYGIPNSNRARNVGINTRYVNYANGKVRSRPQAIVVIGQGNTGVTYSTDRVQAFSNTQVGGGFGFGSPLHATYGALVTVFGSGLDGVPVYLHPVQAGGSATPGTGTLLPVVTTIKKTHSARLIAGGVPSDSFVITPGMTALAITTAAVAAANAVAAFPCTAVDGAALGVQLTSKWAGATANQVTLQVEAESGLGVSWTGPTKLSGGAVDPTAAAVAAALALAPTAGDTVIINCLGNATGVLDAISTAGESRWAPLNRKPFVAFWGTAEPDVAVASGITGARRTDRASSCIPVPASPTMPWVIAAAAAKVVALTANLDPAMGYALNALPGVIPGPESAQWDPDKCETAVRNGLSTTILRDGAVVLSDTITSYRPTGEDPPGFQYVVDIMKLGTILHSLDRIFSSKEWAEAPLIPDDQPTDNENAKHPFQARAEIGKLLMSLGRAALISDPVTAIKNLVCRISAENNRRLDSTIPVQLSGNTNIVNLDVAFGFYFGG